MACVLAHERTLPLLDELETALTSGSSTRGIEMLTSVTDLFVNGAPRFSEDQIGVFDDVMVRLVVRPSKPRRAPSSPNRLAPIANAPANVIHMLAFDDDIEVARPVLTPLRTAQRARTSRHRGEQKPAAPGTPSRSEPRSAKR